MSVEAVSQNPAHKKPTTQTKIPETRWRTISQQRIYGQKLLDAIKSTNNSSQPSKLISPSRAIKEAADSALALTAKGQSRWSRALLTRRWRNRKLLLKAGPKMRRRTGAPRPPAPGQTPKKENDVQNRLRVLSRLVPGARKLSTPTLLEEAADYVAALEMQVKAMRALADLLATTSISTPSDES